MSEEIIHGSAPGTPTASESVVTSPDRAPYVKPKLAPLCVATGTRGKATSFSSELSSWIGPS